MVKPGTNQVARMPRALRNARMRPDAMAPNSPRDSGVGVVMPRAMKPDWVSKSKVRQTMWRGTGVARREGARNYSTIRAGRDVCPVTPLRGHLLPPPDVGRCAAEVSAKGVVEGGQVPEAGRIGN